MNFSRYVGHVTIFSWILTTNIARRPCSDSRHVAALYKLSFYY